MTRSILKGAFAIASVCALSFLPTSCQSGGIGDPCIPEDEYNPTFGGFKVTEENIESRSFQCETRICLVNHFQGRVTCPFGQAAPESCLPGGACSNGGECVEAGVYAPKCGDEGDPECPDPLVCNKEGKFCQCTGAVCPQEGYTCAEDGHCKQYVCKSGDCQSAADTDAASAAGKQCCIPGTKDPVATSVCGQCNAEAGGRDAESAVYCSCRCGPPGDSNEPGPDDNFNYCECPENFECKEIRPDLGIADPQLAGKYCVRTGTFTLPSEAANKCGEVQGNWTSDQCKGTPALSQ